MTALKVEICGAAVVSEQTARREEGRIPNGCVGEMLA
jgi:hypothetical protein